MNILAAEPRSLGPRYVRDQRRDVHGCAGWLLQVDVSDQLHFIRRGRFVQELHVD